MITSFIYSESLTKINTRVQRHHLVLMSAAMRNPRRLFVFGCVSKHEAVGVDGGGSKRIVWTFSVWQINEVFGTKVYMVVKILNNKWGQQKLRTGFSLFKYVELKCNILTKSQAFENYCSQTDLRSKQLFGTTSFELLYLSFHDILYMKFNNLKCNAIVVENMMKYRDG